MSYTYVQLKNEVFDPIKNLNIDNEITTRNIVNRGVRRAAAEVNMASTRRRSALSPFLFDSEYDYAFPSDGKPDGIVDVAPQFSRPRKLEWWLTTPEEFDRWKERNSDLDGEGLMAVNEFDAIKKLRLSLSEDLDQLVIASLDSLTGDGGTWALFGDGTNLIADTDNFVKGSASIRWDISAAGGTTAGIQNTALTPFDFSDYVNQNRSVFVWAYITSATNLTNYKLRLGSDSLNYYEITVTTANEGTAFKTGWNLLRFDFSAKTTTGSPVATAGDFCAIFMTKTAGKVSETGYRFDHVIAQEGRPYDLYYYSRYGWQTNAGAWISDSTADTDILNADQDEFDLITLFCRREAGFDVKSYANVIRARSIEDPAEHQLMQRVLDYRQRHPSQARLLITSRYEFSA